MSNLKVTVTEIKAYQPKVTLRKLGVLEGYYKRSPSI